MGNCELIFSSSKTIVGSRNRRRMALTSESNMTIRFNDLRSLILVNNFSVFAHPFARFGGFVLFQILTRSDCGQKGSNGPDVMSQFEFATPLCICDLLSCFAYLIPFKSYSTFSFWLKNAIGLKFFGF
jgi:hypothetical protein